MRFNTNGLRVQHKLLVKTATRECLRDPPVRTPPAYATREILSIARATRIRRCTRYIYTALRYVRYNSVTHFSKANLQTSMYNDTMGRQNKSYYYAIGKNSAILNRSQSIVVILLLEILTRIYKIIDYFSIDFLFVQSWSTETAVQYGTNVIGL